MLFQHHYHYCMYTSTVFGTSTWYGIFTVFAVVILFLAREQMIVFFSLYLFMRAC